MKNVAGLTFHSSQEHGSDTAIKEAPGFPFGPHFTREADGSARARNTGRSSACHAKKVAVRVSTAAVVYFFLFFWGERT